MVTWILELEMFVLKMPFLNKYNICSCEFLHEKWRNDSLNEFNVF